MILRQTWAMLVDAYRELNAKKLFWITMGLSLLVVGAFGIIGLNEEGIKILVWTLPSEVMNSKVFNPADFYKLTFVGLGIQFWLSIIAMILALVSTASMVPDMISGGSIELVLARPISRVRLFLTKYVSALLFVFLQVLVFSGASFLVIGLRGGAWEPGLFLAVPIVTLFFSYLFGACVLFGVLTRSAIASLLMTLLLWFFTFALNTTEFALLSQKIEAQLSVERHEQVLAETAPKVEELRAELDALRAKDGSDASAGDTPEETKLAARVQSGDAYLQKIRDDMPKYESSVASMTKWHSIFWKVKFALPKTSETTELLERWLVDAANLPKPPESDQPKDDQLTTIFGADTEAAANAKAEPESKRPRSTRVSGSEVQRAMNLELRSRSVTWVLGTSLGFEAFCVGLAVFVFSRRDF